MKNNTIIFVMGVGGCGKSTVAQKLARELGAGWTFLDADDFHPDANKAKMAAGTPLNEDDRKPWLAALRARLDAASRARENIVLACSALRRAHREALIANPARVKLVYLNASRELLRERLASRRGHFLNPSLLENQLAIFDEPTADEAAALLTVDASRPLDAIVDTIRREM